MAKRTPAADVAAKRYRDRRRAVVGAIKRDHGVEAMLVTHPVDIHYLAGIPEGSGALLITRHESIVITNRMFRGVAPAQCPGSEVVIPEVPPDPYLAQRIRKMKLGKVAIQEDKLSLMRHQSLVEAIGPRKLKPTRGVVVLVRSIKDAQEIALTRKAIRIAERAFREMAGEGADHFIGKTEKQIAAELEYRMRRLGANRQAFPGTGIIVGSGPNSASCHHDATNRKVREGEALLIDWGAEVEHYRSDMTRVLFMRSVPDLYREIYPLVEEAMHTGIAALRPGVTNHRVDKLSRDVIADAGHGELFCHSLGHGVGLEIHEFPGLSQHGKPYRLKRNQIVTVEPGIYVAGKGGCRLEDDILITADGCENLCKLPTKMSRMILR